MAGGAGNGVQGGEAGELVALLQAGDGGMRSAKALGQLALGQAGGYALATDDRPEVLLEGLAPSWGPGARGRGFAVMEFWGHHEHLSRFWYQKW